MFFFTDLSSLISTKIISSPIFLIHSQGIIYSLSLQNIPHSFGGPGTMTEIILPVHWSKIRLHTSPSTLQSHTLITSFWVNSENFKFTSLKFFLISYTLNLNNITSPSFTTYSFPSIPTSPFSFAAAKDLHSNKSL